MKKEYAIFTDGISVKYNDTTEIRDKVFNKIMEWYRLNDCYTGESIMQRDTPQLTAAPLLADIADDIIKFDVKWTD